MALAWNHGVVQLMVSVVLALAGALHVCVTPHTLVESFPTRLLTVLFASLEARHETLWNVHRLLKYPKYCFAVPFASEAEWPVSRQEAMVPFAAVPEYQETLFSPEIVLRNEKVMQAIFPTDNVSTLVYKGNMLQEMDLSIADWERPSLHQLVLRALKHALAFELHRAESWGLLEQFIVRSPLSWELFEFLMTQRRMTPTVLALYFSRHKGFGDLLYQLYLHRSVQDTAEVRARMIVLGTAVTSVVAVNEPQRDPGTHAARSKKDALPVFSMIKTTLGLDFSSLVRIALQSSPDYRVPLWDAVALWLHQDDVDTEIAQILDVIATLLATDDLFQSVSLRAVKMIVASYWRHCARSLEADPQGRCMEIFHSFPDQFKADEHKSFDARLKLWHHKGPLKTTILHHRQLPTTFSSMRKSTIRECKLHLRTMASILDNNGSTSLGVGFHDMLEVVVVAWFFLILEAKTLDMELIFPEPNDETMEITWADMFIHWDQLGFLVEGGPLSPTNRIDTILNQYHFYLFTPTEVRRLVDSSFEGDGAASLEEDIAD